MNRLAYKSLGQGKTVILLHGLLGMSDNLMSLAKVLAEQYHVVLPDAVNHGQSPHQKEVDYDSMALDVKQLMQHLAISEAAVLGHSMGGKTAMQLAINFPELVNCLVVADIAPIEYPAREHLTYFSAMQAVERESIASRKDADEILLQQGVKSLPLRQFILKNLKRDDAGHWFWQCGLREMIDNYVTICQAPALRAVYNKPSLFIHGGASKYVEQQDIPIIQRYFPQSELFTIEGASHWLHAEYPDVFANKVLEFLARNAW